MKVFVVDGYINESKVSRLNVDQGLFLIPRKTKGDFNKQGKEIASYVMQDRPKRIIFDKRGAGLGICNSFITEISKFGVKLNDNGILEY